MMMKQEMVMDIRTEKFSAAEFEALERYSNGRIMDLSNVFLLLTDEQVEQLHSDDWSYYHELQEELNYEMGMLSDGQPDEMQEWHDFDPDC